MGYLLGFMGRVDGGVGKCRVGRGHWGCVPELHKSVT